MENQFVMNTANAGRGARIAARIITTLLTAIWVFFGVQYFGNKETIAAIHNQLGYPLYIIPVIGITHILGGLGLQIPGMPRLTEWVYAGLVIDLVLAGLSHLLSGDAFINFLHPLFLIVLVLISYYLRRRMGGTLWSKYTTN